MNEASRKLDALLKRDAAIKAALRAEKDKMKALEERDHERLSRIIGAALLANAAQFPDFDLMLRGVLKTTVSPSSSGYKFLKSKGWLS